MNHLERRKYVRHEIQLTIEYALESGKPIPATTLDVGMGGVSMVSEEEIPVGTKLKIAAPKILRHFSVQGEVLGSAKCDYIASFRHHVQIKESDGKWNLLELIEHCLKKEAGEQAQETSA